MQYESKLIVHIQIQNKNRIRVKIITKKRSSWGYIPFKHVSFYKLKKGFTKGSDMHDFDVSHHIEVTVYYKILKLYKNNLIYIQYQMMPVIRGY